MEALGQTQSYYFTNQHKKIERAIMKLTGITGRYDYSKFGNDPCHQHVSFTNSEFWGIHSADRKIHVDVDRYCAMCKAIGIQDFVPDIFFKNEGKHLEIIPERAHRYDYSVNEFRDLLQALRTDWNEEYKPVFKLIRTPQQVEGDTRTGELMETSCSDDYDEIEIEATMAGLKRYAKYEKVIRSLYFSFISKIASEVDRYTFIVVSKNGYKGIDFDLKSFSQFTNGLSRSKKAIKLCDLSHYNAYSLLHKINNFLKHNSRLSYGALKDSFPKNVVSNQKHPYQNGMFAEDWIVLEENYIDHLFDELIAFFESYCHVYLDEDIEESQWNYEEYFKNAVKELSHPEEYLGLI